jgi:signal transduction histidine kinase
MNWPFLRRASRSHAVLVAVGLTPVALLVCVILLTLTLDRYQSVRHEIIKARVAHNNLMHVLTLLVDAETGERGFLATGAPEFLEPYDKARAALPQDLAQLRRSHTADPVASAQLEQIAPLVARKLQLSQEAVAAKRAGEPTAVALGRERAGKQVMDSLRLRFAVLDARGERDLKAKSDATERDARQVVVLLGITFALLMGMMVRATLVFQRAMARRTAEVRAAQARSSAAEAANEAKSNFLAMMSHEIRTPLNGVLGMAQAMSSDELSARQRDRLDVIQQSGKSLLAILNDILDLSKIEAGKLELEDADFSLAEIAQGAHAAYTAVANGKGLSFNLAITPEARGVYRGDSTRVRQILYNLISNALKFTTEGEVRVELSREAETLFMVVIDTGIGVAPDRLAALFDPFEQAEVSTSRNYGGTGLGLAICRDLAELMGGRISALSELGRGTTFTVRLPLPRVGDERGPAVAPAAIESQAPETLSLRVLAAEDNSVNQLVLKTLLHQIGVEPVIVDDGAEALARWEAEPWDLILLDVQMPVMDGPSAAAAIRASEARTGRPRTPIVALTANAMAHQVADYLAQGMDGVLAKPIEIAALYATIAGVLEAPAEAEASDPVTCARAG